MEESDDIIEQHPVMALGTIVVAGASAYAVISVVIRGVVNTLEVGVFAVIFAVVYITVAFYSDTIEAVFGSD
jgi:hypothetical protein